MAWEMAWSIICSQVDITKQFCQQLAFLHRYVLYGEEEEQQKCFNFSGYVFRSMCIKFIILNITDNCFILWKSKGGCLAPNVRLFFFLHYSLELVMVWIRMAPIGHQLLVPTNVLVTFLLLWKDIKANATYKRVPLIAACLWSQRVSLWLSCQGAW